MKISLFPPAPDSIQAACVEISDHWFTDHYGDNLGEFAIFYPCANPVHYHPRQEKVDRWSRINSAWNMINSSSGESLLPAWRVIFELAEEIAPNLSVYRLQDCFPPCLFWLTSNKDLIEIQARLSDLLPKVSSYWHITRGRGLLHTAAVLHNKKAYLFVGVSGAGKSTVSAISSEMGYEVIHDDHVVVHRGPGGNWLISNSFHTVLDIPLGAIFFLVQDRQDELIPIKFAKTSKQLLESLQEHGRYVLYGDVLKKAFAMCADIARCVPGYELHFRKGPDFWKLIHEQFPD